jgi:lipopolysaccharide assembly outer membrane protein LptD (OstA)
MAVRNLKNLITTMPEGKGRLRLAAMSIDRDWTPPVIHLKGNVRIELWSATPKVSPEVMVLRADEADYRQDTGEILPHGNVRVTLEDAK